MLLRRVYLIGYIVAYSSHLPFRLICACYCVHSAEWCNYGLNGAELTHLAIFITTWHGAVETVLDQQVMIGWSAVSCHFNCTNHEWPATGRHHAVSTKNTSALTLSVVVLSVTYGKLPLLKTKFCLLSETEHLWRHGVHERPETDSIPSILSAHHHLLRAGRGGRAPPL